MSTTSEDELDACWAIAREHLTMTAAPAYTGEVPVRTIRPAAWALGTSPEQSDRLLELVLAGAKRATASAEEDYSAAGEELPGPGMLGIVLDGDGRPRALVVTTAVRVVPFDQVDAEHARAEGEGSHEEWRAEHERFFAETAAGGFRPDMPVVLERFEVAYPEPAGRTRRERRLLGI